MKVFVFKDGMENPLGVFSSFKKAKKAKTHEAKHGNPNAIEWEIEEFILDDPEMTVFDSGNARVEEFDTSGRSWRRG